MTSLQKGKKLSDLLDEQLYADMAENPDIISALDNKTKAGLIVQRSARPTADVSLERQALSLAEMLSELPEQEDITRQMVKLERENKRLSFKLNQLTEMLSHLHTRFIEEQGIDIEPILQLMMKVQNNACMVYLHRHTAKWSRAEIDRLTKEALNVAHGENPEASEEADDLPEPLAE